jgi:hypothetical protein
MPEASSESTPKNSRRSYMLLLLYVPAFVFSYSVLAWLGISTTLKCLIPFIPIVIQAILFFASTREQEGVWKVISRQWKESEATNTEARLTETPGTMQNLEAGINVQTTTIRSLDQERTLSHIAHLEIENACLQASLAAAREEAKDLRAEFGFDCAVEMLEEEYKIQLRALDHKKSDLEAIVLYLKSDIENLTDRLELGEDFCTMREMRIAALEKEVGALRACVETSRAVVESLNIQSLKEAKLSAEKDLEDVRESLVTTRTELQEAELANGVLELDLAEEKQAQTTLAAMLRTRDGENKHLAAIVRSHKVTITVMQHELVKNHNALIAKDEVVAQYRDRLEVQQERYHEAVSKVVELVEERRKRKEEEELDKVLGMTKEDMLENAGCEIVRLQGRIDELAWEVEKMREEREEVGKAHEHTNELAGNEIASLNGEVHEMAFEMASSGEGVLEKGKNKGPVEEEELAYDMPKMREVSNQIENEEEVQEEVLESSESGWDQVSETEARSGSP